MSASLAVDSAVEGATDDWGLRNENHRTTTEHYSFDTLSCQGLNTKFDSKGNPEADGFRLYGQLSIHTDRSGKRRLGDRRKWRSCRKALFKPVSSSAERGNNIGSWFHTWEEPVATVDIRVLDVSSFCLNLCLEDDRTPPTLKRHTGCRA